MFLKIIKVLCSNNVVNGKPTPISGYKDKDNEYMTWSFIGGISEIYLTSCLRQLELMA